MKKIVRNRFDKLFGPAGSLAGLGIAIAGFALTFVTPAFILLILFGSFVAFSNTSTTINTVERKIRYSTNLFGIIKLGNWITLKKGMEVKIMRNNKSFRACRWGKRKTIIKTHTYKVALFYHGNKEILPVRYFENLIRAQQFAQELNNYLSRIRIMHC